MAFQSYRYPHLTSISISSGTRPTWKDHLKQSGIDRSIRSEKLGRTKLGCAVSPHLNDIFHGHLTTLAYSMRVPGAWDQVIMQNYRDMSVWHSLADYSIVGL